jgi:hypothetical protein
MLGQGLDRSEGRERLGTGPVVGELLGVESCPLANESECPNRERAVEDPQRP